MIDFAEQTDRELIRYQSYLRDAISRSKKGWLPFMAERWGEVKSAVESEMRKRGLVTTIKIEG